MTPEERIERRAAELAQIATKTNAELVELADLGDRTWDGRAQTVLLERAQGGDEEARAILDRRNAEPIDRIEGDLRELDGLEERAAAAFQLTKDAEVADLSDAFDGGQAVMINPTEEDLRAAKLGEMKEPPAFVSYADTPPDIPQGELLSPFPNGLTSGDGNVMTRELADPEACDHDLTRVDANMVRLLNGSRELRVSARCERCRHRFVFNVRESHGIALDASGTIVSLDVLLGELDTMRVCSSCRKDHANPDGGDRCRACVTESRATNKNERTRPR